MDQTLLAQNARRVLLAATMVEVGIRVKVLARDLIDPAGRGRQVLYRFKNEDPALSQLQIRHDPDDPKNYLWLIRTDTGLVAQKDESELSKEESSVVPFPSIDLKF